jgi:hypothetical protein
MVMEPGWLFVTFTAKKKIVALVYELPPKGNAFWNMLAVTQGLTK